MPFSSTVAMPCPIDTDTVTLSSLLIVPVACVASGSSVSSCPLLVAPVSVTTTVSSASKTSSVRRVDDDLAGGEARRNDDRAGDHAA